jgi:hypothetical protein
LNNPEKNYYQAPPTLALNSRDPKITKIIARLAEPNISWHTAFHVFITSNN